MSYEQAVTLCFSLKKYELLIETVNENYSLLPCFKILFPDNFFSATYIFQNVRTGRAQLEFTANDQCVESDLAFQN